MKAIILAAGNGTRMGDLTKDLPKPLLPYQGKPFIQHIIDRLIKAHISEIHLVINPKYKEQFLDVISNNHGICINLVYQPFSLGTAHALSLCASYIHSCYFILTYGDILFAQEDYDYFCNNVVQFPNMAINEVEDPYNGCAVYLDKQNNVIQIIEKPMRETSNTNWNGAGLFLLDEGIFNHLKEKQPKCFGLDREWNFTKMFQQYLFYMNSYQIIWCGTYPVKEWTHIENQEVYQQLLKSETK
jgi:dTDP-glucose pyrophosphorylase